MAEALVSAVIQQLVSLTTEWVFKKVKLVKNVKEDMRTLESHLNAVKDVLTDAEKKQFSNKQVRDWLDKLKDVYEDMNDVFDEWNTIMLRSKIERETTNALFDIKKKVLPPCFCFKKVEKLVLKYDIAIKIKEFSQDLARISQEKQNFHFSTIGDPEQPKIKTTSFVVVSQVFGRDKEKEFIKRKLLRDEGSYAGEKIGIIPIVGAGGMGKTTLAQLVYNDDSVMAHFDKQIWVCVSDPFDSTVVAKAIIERLGSDAKHLNELESLHYEIRKLIKDKRFLLVLDDVWHEVEDGKWEQLMQPLRHGGVGSKIVVTTRKMTVASMMRANNNVIDLQVLSNDLCWLIFKNQAFLGRSQEECQQLEEIGKDIVKKCKGLPLVAKILGGVMYSKKGRLKWENVLRSELWDVNVEAQVFSPYLLSYYDLPSLERHCFKFCSIFPKDYEIERETLIEMWMSQGYFDMKGNPEKEGEDCFENLAMRSFFQDFEKDEDGIITSCKMHDIVHDFAQYLTKKESLMILYGKDITNLPNHNCGKIRNVTITSSSNESINVYYEKIPQHRLHNLFIKYTFYSKGENALMLSNLTSLRSLTFCFGNLQVMHKDIGKLTHLRYLHLFGTSGPEDLLSSLYNLWNLQTLKIQPRGWGTPNRLLLGIEKLVNLRHLYVQDYSILPKGITELRNLQTVDVIHVKGHDDQGCSILTSNDLKKLHGVKVKSLVIDGWNEIDQNQNPLLMNWEGLQDLIIKLKKQPSQEVKQEEILNALQPHPNLKYLRIFHYMASTLCPSWTTSLTNLRKIILFKLPYCSKILMPLGKLPVLKELSLTSMSGLENLGSEFWGTAIVEGGGREESDHNIVVLFPKLEILGFEKMYAWKEWGIAVEDCKPSKIIAPLLRSSSFMDCPAIEAIPEFLLNKGLQELRISYSCKRLLKRYERETGPDWAKISHIPKVYFRHRWNIWSRERMRRVHG